MALDSVDRAIIEALCEDGRLSHRQLAQRLGVAQGTITNRLRKLENDGVILGYAPTLNADSVGWGMTVMAGLCIEKGKIMDVQKHISADHRVFAVYDVTGDWDWIDGFFCRTILWGKRELKYNCQKVTFDGKRLRFISDRGKGNSASFAIR